MSANSNENLMTPANVVTLIRIIFVPVFVVVLLSPWPSWFPEVPWLAAWQPWIAAALFIVLAATDSLDGYLARSRNEVTTFGKFMDPLADKLLVCSALVALVELRILPAWVVIIIIARDFIMSGIRLMAASRGEVIAASWYGKFKTVFQMIAIVMFLVMGSLSQLFSDSFVKVFGVLSWVMMGIALVLTIVSLVDYFYNARFVLGISDEQDAGAGADDALPDGREGERRDLARCCEALAEQVIAAGVRTGRTVSTCESLTGGLVGGYLTTVPGSSAVVAGGLITYTCETKHALANVSEADLAETGPVDEAIAAQMAEGSRTSCGSDIAVAVTGIAGPTGSEPGKPVGTVCFGLATSEGTRTERLVFSGDRQEVRLQTVEHALELVFSALNPSAM